LRGAIAVLVLAHRRPGRVRNPAGWLLSVLRRSSSAERQRAVARLLELPIVTERKDPKPCQKTTFETA
jgi:hypothetical protein